MEEPNEAFASVLRRLRQQAGLTQELLAERAGLSTNAVSALERGDRQRPYRRTVLALADALGLGAAERIELLDSVPRPANKGAGRTPGRVPTLVPRQLPATIQRLVGREAALSQLDALLMPSPACRPASTAVVTITGTAGVGKSTLALAWAHRARAQFPDGQLYVNLRGYHPDAPADPAEVLDGFLRALHVPAEQIPQSPDQRAAMFRSIVDGRRLLTVLDNAGNAEQVRALLPGSPGNAVLITSRNGLTGLAVSAGASRIPLGLLPSADAESMLCAGIGPARCAAEPAAVARLVALCAGLPLALELAVQRAVARTDLGLRDLVEELTAESDRLDVLSSGADEVTAVRSVFSWSYRSLSPPQRRIFCMLGLHPAADITAPSAAALAAVEPTAARRLLDGLTDAHLLESGGRSFRLHDLLRAYAGECAAELDAGDRDQALDRLIGFYLHTAAAAVQVIHPGRRPPPVDAAPPPPHTISFTGYAAAVRWCEAECDTMLTIVRTAADTGRTAAAWQLPDHLWSFFYLRKRWTQWVNACRVGLLAARSAADTAGELRMLAGLAAAHRDQHRFSEAIGHYRQVLRLAKRIGDRRSEGTAWSNLGDAYLGLGQYRRSLRHSERGLRLLRDDDTYLHGVVLGNLGEAYIGLGWYRRALETFDDVLRLCRQIGHRQGEARTLRHLGEALLGLGDLDTAARYLTESLEVHVDVGDQHGEAIARRRLAAVAATAGQFDVARAHLAVALDTFTDLGDPQADEVRAELMAS